MTSLTRDNFLDGKISLLQPLTGYRAGVDPVLLAAAVPANKGQTVLELGCGVGAASLCLAARIPDLSLTGVELQEDYANLAKQNATENGIVMEVVTADLRKLPADIRNRQFDHVIMNPPYFDRTASTPSEDGGKDIAFGGDTPLSDWITTGAKRLTQRGYLTLIQRIERLPETLASAQSCLGSLVVLPIAARGHSAPKLFILQGRKGGRAAFHMSPPLVMHVGATHIRDGESYTDELRGVLRSGQALPVIR